MTIEEKEKILLDMSNLLKAQEERQKQNNISKREYFAAMAMQGMLSNSFWAEQYNKHAIIGNAGITTTKEEDVAEYSIKYADELIKQLNHEQ